jgi:hypothetical protein
MVRCIIAIVIAFAVISTAVHAAERELSVQALQAVVVKTVPESGDTKVDPNLTEIRVTFSKKMHDGSWSWSQMSEDTQLLATGKPHYLADGKTCVLPVKLAPGKTYVSWLNSQKFGNFKDADGQSAVPYLLVFQTRDAATGKTSAEK